MNHHLKALTLGLAASFVGSDALACGGMFCSNQSQPVDQAAERILFAVDKEQGTVEAHVQISYTGSAEQFAWVVPVQAVPELFPSVDDIFTTLSPFTMPLWNLTFTTEGTCKDEGRNGLMVSAPESADFDTAGGEPPQDGGGVTQVDAGAVGPYDYAVVQADSIESLVEWLDDPNADGDTTDAYFIPDSFDEAAAPYVTSGHFFLALRLQKDKDVGDLVPLGMRYEGSEASIPLQLTAIAATPDMRLQPFVLGDARAVPVNYLHVEVNELAVNWMDAGNNYPDVITQAANEAGGQAFATDFSGSTDAFDGVFWASGRYRPGVLMTTAHPFDLVNTMQFEAGIPVSNGTVPTLLEFFPMPAVVAQDGVTPLEFYACMDCYVSRDAFQPVDGTAFAEALDAGWVEAMRNAQDLFDRHPVLTRLTSSISAEEMTIDPIFALNEDMPMVDRNHSAEFVTLCNPSVERFEAPRMLRLADGREMLFPAEYANDPTNFDFDGFIGDIGNHAAQTISQTGRDGDAQVMTSNLDAINGALEAHNTAMRAELGCASGCSQGGAAFGWMGLGLGLVGLRRRRR